MNKNLRSKINYISGIYLGLTSKVNYISGIYQAYHQEKSSPNQTKSESENTIPTNNNNNNLEETLLTVCKNEKLSLFHTSAEYILKYIRAYKQHTEEDSVLGENQVKIDNKIYHLSDQLTDFFTTYDCNMRGSHFKHKENILRKAIEEIQKEITGNCTQKSKYIYFLKEFFAMDGATYFLHDYFHFLIVKNNAVNQKFKLTSLNIELADCIIRFIIAQKPKLKAVYNCFDKIECLNMSVNQKNIIIELATLIFKKNIADNDKNVFFQTLNIKHYTIRNYILDYFRDLFFKAFRQNRIYIVEVTNIINNFISEIKEIDFIAKIYQDFVTLGHYLLDFFIQKGLFTETKQPLGNKKDLVIILEPTNKLVEDVMLKKSHQKPYLREEDLKRRNNSNQERKIYDDIINKNIHKLIHDNMKINLFLNKESYIHETKLYTKFSINVNFLIFFLKLINNGIKDDYLYSLYDIDRNKIKELSEVPGASYFLDIILDAARNFNEYSTVNKLQEQINDNFKNLRKQESIKINEEYFDSLKKLEKTYKAAFFDLINKICHRKHQLINLIQEAITHSIFKFFIGTTFIDTRGRAYLSLIDLNIFNNPLGKMFVSLYDPNEGALPSGDDIRCLSNYFQFEQTKDALYIVANQNIKTQMINCIYDYICNYINLKRDDLENIIKDDKFFKDPIMQLDFLMTKIKKHKKLFYVHSLIYYEQLRYRGKHDTNIFNYFQKDASSSGLQMLSILFRDPVLAEIANVKGNSNSDIYQRASENCCLTYNSFTQFVCLNVEWAGVDYFHRENFSVELKEYGVDWFKENSHVLDNNKTLLAMLLCINIEKSYIWRDFLKILVKTLIAYNKKTEKLLDFKKSEFILPYLKIKDIENIKALSRLDDFKDYKQILQYIYCLRYAARLVWSVDKNICKDPYNSFLKKRELTKKHVMTTLYMSTAFTRKEAYIKLMKDEFLLSDVGLNELEEFASFLEKATTKYLEQSIGLNRIADFTNDICTNKEIIIQNRNFTITLQPKITKDFQVSCSSYTKKRGPQLVVKKITNQIDPVKLKSMFMANLAHSMDSDLMHHFTEICLDLNERLKKQKSAYRFAFERNHDCFILNYPPLLTIFLEEAYLRLSKQDNINNIQYLTPELKSKYVKLSPEEFVSKLNPINPNFVK